MDKETIGSALINMACHMQISYTLIVHIDIFVFSLFDKKLMYVSESILYKLEDWRAQGLPILKLGHKCSKIVSLDFIS